MKKLFLFAAAFSLSVMAARAQAREQEFTLGGGVNVNIPTGNLSNGWSLGIGFQLQGELRLAESVTGVGTIGYTNYFGKTIDEGGGASFKLPNIGFVPILVGARFYPSETFFVGGQIGLGFFTNTGGSGNTGFDFYPQIGYNASGYQLILGYNVVSVSAGSNSNLALTGIFKFGGN